jgi:hypothetical protein
MWGSGGIAPPYLTSVLVGDEWSASRPGRFTPGGRVPGTHWIGGWADPRTGLDAAEKKKWYLAGVSNRKIILMITIILTYLHAYSAPRGQLNTPADYNNNNNNNNNKINIYLRANLTAQRPITKSAQGRRKKQQNN